MIGKDNSRDRLTGTPTSEVAGDDVYDAAGYLVIPATGELRAQHISDFDHQRRILRESIGIYSTPLTACRLLIQGFVAVIKSCFVIALTHPIVIYLIIPLLILWLAVENVDRLENSVIGVVVDKVEFYVQYGVWWIGLGILSSIGLGSGLQSGVLFLFPHIFRVCLAAQACQSIDFESSGDMWFRTPPNLFQCPDKPPPSGGVTFFDMWSKVIVVCVLQAAGTAIGEIPPYWMTRAARLAAMEGGEDSETLPEELRAGKTESLVGKFTSWMVNFLRVYGFCGVLTMASFPNLAFDLCGIACGHFLMPFWTFFLATLLGKAVIRVSYQSVVYVALCSENYLELLIMALQRLSPDSLALDHTIRNLLEEGRASFQKGLSPSPSATTSQKSPVYVSWIDRFKFASVGEAFKFWWSEVFMRAMLLAFLLSCATQFAQYYQLLLDREESNKLRERLPAKLRANITSPLSGRLQLPPPSTRKKNRKKRESVDSNSTPLQPTRKSPYKTPQSMDRSTTKDSPFIRRSPMPISRTASSPVRPTTHHKLSPATIKGIVSDHGVRSLSVSPVRLSPIGVSTTAPKSPSAPVRRKQTVSPMPSPRRLIDNNSINLALSN